MLEAAAQPAVVRTIERDLFGNELVRETVAAKPKGRRYDRLMEDALAQAKGYALALPAEHGWPPFLIVCDVGRAFEVYFDWSGNGKGYGFFPDQSSYRIELAALRLSDIRKRLTGIWTAPASIDPRRQTVKVTREIAERLARVSKYLEAEQRGQLKTREDGLVSTGIEESSMFLMRMLFCMFAEDVGLLPEKTFQGFLADSIGKSDQYWRSGLNDLWSRMSMKEAANRYWAFGDTVVRYFNGNLFEGYRIFDLPREEKGELLEAARTQWRDVEPAIFGTLLEQALTETERAKLGAHYTPRPYVERLVDATMMEGLRADWEALRTAENGPALADVTAFLEQLGGDAVPKVGPNQFLGLELNPRAAVIAELVLWIGWLRFRLANDPESIGEPVLPPLRNINFGGHGGYDALLAADEASGAAADLETPRAAVWPEADYIVGNPPFIGAKFLRAKLGGDYAEALWRVRPEVPKSADFVMQWWDRAAGELLRAGSKLQRFGFVTTNSITQSFSRRVLEARLEGGLSLVMAIADHPWTRATRDAAAVRIAMTVAEAGVREGRLLTVLEEAGLDTDAPVLAIVETRGAINADLSVGTDVTQAVALRANAGVASPGVKLHGDGFILTLVQAEALGLGQRDGLEAHIRPYRNGRDLLQRSRDVMVIDLFGLGETAVRQRFPEVYQHLLKTVKPERDANRRATYRDNWWIFGEPRREMRPALAGLRRYIATPVTARHRVFTFIDREILPDDALMVVAADDAFHLGVLSSAAHGEWCQSQGGTLEDRPRYIKSQIFDPFPFPDATCAQRAGIAGIAEELELTRRVALAENPGLTMTGLYNLVAPLRAGVVLDAAQEAAATRGRARIVAKLHDDLDAAVAEAYGWPKGLSAGEIVARLVALNAARAEEEAGGLVRWLRPDYQMARAGLRITSGVT